MATLVLSGQFVGFLPDHYAEAFVRQDKMRAISSATLRYDCQFSAILRQSPKPTRLTEAFFQVLCEAHGVALG